MGRCGKDVAGMEVKTLDCPGEVLERSVCAACAVGLSEVDGAGEGQGEEEGENGEMHLFGW